MGLSCWVLREEEVKQFRFFFLSFFLLLLLLLFFFFFLCYCGKWEISTWINKMGNRDSPHDSDHFLTLAEQEQRTKALSDATA